MASYDWTIVKSRHLIKDKWISVRADTCKMPSGKIVSPYYVLEYPAWLNVVALTKNQEVILVQQYRHGCQKTVIELPSGCMEITDKTPLEAMKRELLEETGYSSNNFIEVCKISANPANLNNFTHGFLALEVDLVAEPKLDDTEQIKVIRRPLHEVIAMMKNQEFLQALHVSTLFYALSSMGNIQL